MTIPRNTEPEFASIETFVTLLLDDERLSVTQVEIATVARRTGRTVKETTAILITTWGLSLGPPPAPKGRGFGANDHNRWTGELTEKCHGGSGHEQINGFAGREG